MVGVASIVRNDKWMVGTTLCLVGGAVDIVKVNHDQDHRQNIGYRDDDDCHIMCKEDQSRNVFAIQTQNNKICQPTNTKPVLLKHSYVD